MPGNKKSSGSSGTSETILSPRLTRTPESSCSPPRRSARIRLQQEALASASTKEHTRLKLSHRPEQNSTKEQNASVGETEEEKLSIAPSPPAPSPPAPSPPAQTPPANRVLPSDGRSGSANSDLVLKLYMAGRLYSIFDHKTRTYVYKANNNAYRKYSISYVDGICYEIHDVDNNLVYCKPKEGNN